jgi:hypothetical protein
MTAGDGGPPEQQPAPADSDHAAISDTSKIVIGTYPAGVRGRLLRINSTTTKSSQRFVRL